MLIENRDINVFSIVTDANNIIWNRLILFMLNIPLLLSIVFVMTVDGLVQRDIRKYQGARESAFFFHRIKPLAGKICGLIYLFYMAIPFDFYPNILLLTMVIVCGWFTLLSIKNYKKYI